MSLTRSPVTVQPESVGFKVIERAGSPVRSSPASRDLSEAEKVRVAETRRLWLERETCKPFDPMSLVERTGITYVPPAYTKESFDKLQSLYIEEVLRLQAEQRKYQDAKDTAEAEVVALKESMKQLMQDRDRAVREDNAESNPTSNVGSGLSYFDALTAPVKDVLDLVLSGNPEDAERLMFSAPVPPAQPGRDGKSDKERRLQRTIARLEAENERLRDELRHSRGASESDHSSLLNFNEQLQQEVRACLSEISELRRKLRYRDDEITSLKSLLSTHPATNKGEASTSGNIGGRGSGMLSHGLNPGRYVSPKGSSPSELESELAKTKVELASALQSMHDYEHIVACTKLELAQAKSCVETLEDELRVARDRLAVLQPPVYTGSHAPNSFHTPPRRRSLLVPGSGIASESLLVSFPGTSPPVTPHTTSQPSSAKPSPTASSSLFMKILGR